MASLALHQHFGIERPECSGYSLNQVLQGLSGREIVKYDGLAGNLLENVPGERRPKPQSISDQGYEDCTCPLHLRKVLSIFISSSVQTSCSSSTRGDVARSEQVTHRNIKICRAAIREIRMEDVTWSIS